jgi:hypothetical protein
MDNPIYVSHPIPHHVLNWTNYRWNPDLERMEYWSPGSAAWRKSKSPREAHEVDTSFDDTWTEPIKEEEEA